MTVEEYMEEMGLLPKPSRRTRLIEQYAGLIFTSIVCRGWDGEKVIEEAANLADAVIEATKETE